MSVPEGALVEESLRLGAVPCTVMARGFAVAVAPESPVGVLSVHPASNGRLRTRLLEARIEGACRQGEFAGPTAWSGHDHHFLPPEAPTGSGVRRDEARVALAFLVQEDFLVWGRSRAARRSPRERSLQARS